MYSVSSQIGLEFTKSKRTENKTVVKAEESENSTEIKPGMAFLTSLGKTSALQPKIDLVASKRFTKSNDSNSYVFFAESKLYIGSQDKKDKRSLFVDEYSGFSFYNTIGVNPKIFNKPHDVLNPYFNFAYQGKSFYLTDSTEANPGVLGLKIGLELILFTNFSLYGDYNFLQILHGSEDYQKLSNVTLREQYRFWKIGFRAVLDLLEKGQGTLGLHIGLILNNKETKRFHGSNDFAIPVVELKFSTNVNK